MNSIPNPPNRRIPDEIAGRFESLSPAGSNQNAA
jgi:hypothetical protein